MPVRLALACARPEIVAIDDERFLRSPVRFVDDGDAAVLADGYKRCQGHDRRPELALEKAGKFNGRCGNLPDSASECR